MVPFLSALIYFLLLIMSIFLICLVLIQRGKGGGLAGAFGGVGGSSAFGTKAGDVFTRVTMITAGIWIALNMVLVILSNQRTSAWGDTPVPGSASQSAFTPSTDKTKPGDRPASAPSTGAPAAASPFDALAPANPNTVVPSPLGKGGTPTPGPGTNTGTGTGSGPAAAPASSRSATPETKSELPPAFPSEAPTSAPVSGPNSPKP